MAHLDKFDWFLIIVFSAASIIVAIESGSIWPAIDVGCVAWLYAVGVSSARENRELKETIRTLRESIKEELK